MATKKTKKPAKKMTTKKPSLVKRVISKITSTPEQKEAKKLVKHGKAKGVTLPYFSINGGGVVRTSDGHIYKTHEEFIEDGGAPDYSNVAKIVE